MDVPTPWGPGGRYELTESLDHDSAGTLWRGRSRADGAPVLVRLARIGPDADWPTVAELRTEWPRIAAVRHRALIGVRDLVLDGDRLGLVTELVDGTALRDHLRAVGSMRPAQAAGMATELAEAIATIHAAGTVHSNVTARSVLVASDGQVRLADLATARLTRRHAPPYEVPADDVHALGVVLNEMLLGTAPNHGGRVGDAEPVWPVGMPSGLRYVLGRCLRRDPAERPAAAAVAADLRALSAQLADVPPVRSPGPDATRYRVLDEPASGEAPSTGRHSPDRLPEASVQPASRPLVRRLVAVVAGLAILGTVAVAATAALRQSPVDRPSASGTGSRPASRAPTGAALARPSLSAAATRRTLDGASQFVTYWFDTLNHAVRTGDVGELTAASSPRCAPCQAAIDRAGRSYAGGGSLQGGVYLLQSVIVGEFPASGEPAVDVVLDRSARSTLDPDGHVQDTMAGVSFMVCRVLVEWSGGQWHVVAMTAPAPIV